MTCADCLENNRKMIERDGEEWISVREIAASEGVPITTVWGRLAKREIERKCFPEQRTGPPGTHIRKRDYDAWVQERAKAAEVPELPEHLANVWLPIGKAALIARRDRPVLYRAIQNGDLRAGITSFLDPMIRLGDLAEWAREASIARNAPRGLDPVLLAELDAATRPAAEGEAA